MRGTRGARRGPSSKGLCQVQGGCSLREADGRSGGQPMVDLLAAALCGRVFREKRLAVKSEEYKFMSWLTSAGATLSRNLRISTCFRAVYWFPQFVLLSLVRLRAGRLLLLGTPTGVSEVEASCGFGETTSR